MSGRIGGKGPTDVFLNPEPWEDLAGALETKGIRKLEDTEHRFGALKLVLAAGGRSCNIWADRYCPSDVAFALRLQNWKLRSYEPCPTVVNGDGLQMLRKAAANTYEYRLQSYPAFSCNAPGWNGRVAMT